MSSYGISSMAGGTIRAINMLAQGKVRLETCVFWVGVTTAKELECMSLPIYRI